MAPPADDPPHPRTTAFLIGHARAEAALARALASGRLPHGWLFTGPQGIGKATLAYRFARALLAGAPGADRLALSPDHPVARQVAAGAHPDLRVVELPRDEKTGRLKSEIPVDAIRAATQALRSTAAAGGRRVLLVDGADRLNRNAANALLKMLEEPPAGVVILLVAHRVGGVPATVRSRSAELRLRPLAPAELADGLARLAPMAEEEAQALAALAGGSLGRALELRALGARALYARLLATAVAADSVARLDLAEELARLADRHGLTLVALLIGAVLRRAVDHGLGRPLLAPLAPDEAESLARLAAATPLDRLGALWDNLAGLAGRVEQLHLDRTHALVHMLSSLAPAARG